MGPPWPHLESVIRLAERAAIGSVPWTRVAEDLGRHFRANGVALFSDAAAPGADVAGGTWGTARSSAQEYFERWAVEDAWLAAVARRGLLARGGDIAVGPELVPTHELRRSAYFNEFLRPHDIEGLMTARLCVAHDDWAPSTYLSFFRAPGQDDFAESDKRALRAIAPQLRHAVQIYAALDALPQPSWLLREDGTVDHANDAATAFARQYPGAVRVTAGRLVALGWMSHGELAQAIVAARAGRVDPVSVALRLDPRPQPATRLSSTPGPRRAQLRFAAVPPDSPFSRVWPRAVVPCMLELPPDHGAAGWLRQLATIYGLTAAEMRVLGRLCAGLSPKEMAEALCVSYTTVRTHLLALYDKTGTHRQAELVRLAGGEAPWDPT